MTEESKWINVTQRVSEFSQDVDELSALEVPPTESETYALWKAAKLDTDDALKRYYKKEKRCLYMMKNFADHSVEDAFKDVQIAMRDVFAQYHNQIVSLATSCGTLYSELDHWKTTFEGEIQNLGGCKEPCCNIHEQEWNDKLRETTEES